MYEYWADLRFYSTLDTCFSVIRGKDGVLEGYQPTSNTWEESPRLYDMHIGELEVEKITEEQANKIIARLIKQYGKSA